MLIHTDCVCVLSRSWAAGRSHGTSHVSIMASENLIFYIPVLPDIPGRNVKPNIVLLNPPIQQMKTAGHNRSIIQRGRDLGVCRGTELVPTRIRPRFFTIRCTTALSYFRCFHWCDSAAFVHRRRRHWAPCDSLPLRACNHGDPPPSVEVTTSLPAVTRVTRNSAADLKRRLSSN